MWEWKRVACQHKVIMTTVQSQNNPRVEEQESTLPEALWLRGNNGCIPPLPPALWYQSYQRAVHWFRQALSETPNPQSDHISAGLLITPLPSWINSYAMKGLSHAVWKAPSPFQLLHTSLLLPIGFPLVKYCNMYNCPPTKVPTSSKAKILPPYRYVYHFRHTHLDLWSSKSMSQ